MQVVTIGPCQGGQFGSLVPLTERRPGCGSAQSGRFPFGHSNEPVAACEPSLASKRVCGEEEGKGRHLGLLPLCLSRAGPFIRISLFSVS